MILSMRICVTLVCGVITPCLGSFVLSECYGAVLGLSCRYGHKIHVIEDYFGLSNRTSGTDQCKSMDGDCVVKSRRETSVIHRFCEGQQTCNRFQVDRRHCGENQTNYEQVKFDCIPESSISDICIPTKYETKLGYLSSPLFPNEYSPNLDCQCTLKASDPYVKIELETIHFIVKFDTPCKDWLEIGMGDQKRKVCGPYRATLLSDVYALKFHSDKANGHQGFWMKFSVYPPKSNATVKVECNMIQTTTTTTTTTTEATTTALATTQESEELTDLYDTLGEEYDYKDYTEYIQDSNEVDEDKYKTTATSASTTKYRKPTTQESTDSNTLVETDDPDEYFELEPTYATTSARPVKKKKTKLRKKKVKLRKENKGNEVQLSPTSDTYLLEEDLENLDGLIIEEENDANMTYPNGTLISSYEDSIAEDTDKRKAVNRMTGIIIIAICVGGIILLITILGILLCVSKRRKPKKKEERLRKRRLQQRLNSLSFYDSIPLYDSVGRKTVPQGMQEHHGVYNVGMANMVPAQAQGPYDTAPKPPGWKDWGSQEGGSDKDSAVYAELSDKQSRGGRSEAEDTPDRSRKPRKEHHDDLDSGVSLKVPKERSLDDVYTHV
ncbi:unnamed protein product [Owenia fusiformis]|uniref:Uncharacterized protein n=1 Tax=Owenia fusiformis TaxID=6347 RepID=A0A8J1XJU6_OWEFU|nr:unnamed protein product [Owenia fusiformis]